MYIHMYDTKLITSLYIWLLSNSKREINHIMHN